MKKYDFQKPSKIPHFETTSMPTRILLKKRRFKCYHCSKMMVAETSLVKNNHQMPRIINQKIAQKLIEKTSMTDIAHQLAISTSTVIRKLNDFRFKHDFSSLPKIMSWDEYAFTKGKMSFIAQDFDNLNIITVLEGRTQTIIEITFCSTIESFAVRWKSLLWICLALTTTWLNSFAFEFLGSAWNSLPDCFTP